MENSDIRNIIPMLRQFGISPEQLGPEKINKLLKLSEYIKGYKIRENKSPGEEIIMMFLWISLVFVILINSIFI